MRRYQEMGHYPNSVEEKVLKIFQCRFDPDVAHMSELTFRIKTHRNINVKDPAFVESVTDKLMQDYPQIEGYLIDYDGDDLILIIYGQLGT